MISSNKQKGISLVIFVVTIIVTLILTSVVILTVVDKTPIDEAEEATLRSDFTTIKNKYHEEYTNLIYEHLGRKDEVTDEELQSIIPEEYKNDLIATKDGISYVGNNEKIKEIAKNVGLYIGYPTESVEIVFEKLESVQNTISITIGFGTSNISIKEVEYLISEDGKDWISKKTTEKTCDFTDLNEFREYKVKVIVTDTNNKKYESDIYSIVTGVKDFEAAKLNLTIGLASGNAYTDGSWVNQDVYVKVEEMENAITTYTATGANVINKTSAESILKNEGITNIAVTTIKFNKYTKTSEHVVKIDKSLPIINELKANSTEVTTSDITITGKAIDNLSGIVGYQFSKDENVTVDSTGWTDISNTKDEITQSYTTAENGIYYFYVKDEAGNVTKQEIVVSNIDREAPILESISVSSPESGAHVEGDEITIEAVYDEEIKDDNTTLKIKFGEGEERTLEKGIISENKIIYKYVIKGDDLGALISTSYSGTIKDKVGNELTVNNMTISGNQITAVVPQLQAWNSNSTTDFHAEEYRTKITKAVLKDNVTVPEGAVSWDVSKNKNGSVIAYVENDGNDGYILTIGGKGKIYANETSSNLFYRFTALKEIENLQLLDTSKAITMQAMFIGCSSLTNLDLSSFDTSKVTNTSYMFNECSGLVDLDISGFNTENITSMYSMFEHCSSLINLDLSNFNTNNVKNMSRMFFDCYSLVSLDVSGFNTSQVNDMGNMFSGCKALANLDVSSFDTGNVTNMSSMFAGCRILTNLDLSNFNTSQVNMMAGMFNLCNGLISLNLSDFNTSNVTDMRAMFNECSSLTSLDLNSFDTSQVTDMNFMFRWCSSLTSLDLSNFNTSNIINMNSMFYACESLTSLNLNSFDTSKVTNMGNMFYKCRSLTNLDLSNFNTSNVNNMEWMFRDCDVLTELDLSNFNTSNVTNMNQMFNGCDNLKKLDVSSFDTSKVTNMATMFSGCSELLTLDLGNFKLDSVTNIKSMFQGCHKLSTTIMIDNLNITEYENMFLYAADVAPAEIIVDYTEETDALTDLMIATKSPTSNVHKRYETIQSWAQNSTTDFHAEEYRTKITKVVFKDNIDVPEGITPWDVSAKQNGRVIAYVEDDGSEGYVLTIGGNGKIYANENSNYLFYSFTALKEIENLELLDTSNVTSMISMFNGCSSLTNLDLSNFDTNQVTNMQGMFAGCSSLTSLDVSSFDTSNVTTMNSMFYRCGNITALELNNFNTSNVTSMSSMFNSCDSLTSLNLNNFKVDKVKNMRGIFSKCSNLTSLDVSNFDTSNVTDMREMFYGCSNLASLDVSNFNTSQVTNMKSMFIGCSSLTTLDVSKFDTSQVTNMIYMFQKCSELTSLDLSNFDTSSVTDNTRLFADCTKLQEVKLGEKFSFLGDGTIATTNMQYFPTPSNKYIPGADGKWYGLKNGTSYASSEIPNNVADTYTVIPLTNKLITGKDFNAIIPEEATKVVFTDEAIPAGVNVTDVSEAQSMGIVAWLDGTTYKVSTRRSGVKIEANEDSSSMFYGKDLLNAIEFNNFDTSKVTNMWYMFYRCNSLTSLDLSNFNTSNVTSMVAMFRECSSLTSLNISSFNTSKVENMHIMFEGCSSLKNLDLINFDTSEVIDMESMFEGCSSLISLNVSNFDTSSVEEMINMFNGCSSLTSLNVSSFDTNQVENMRGMFEGCTKLTNLDVSGFDTSCVVDSMSDMFAGSSSLVYLDLSSFDTSHLKTMNDMFNECYKLQEVKLGEKFAFVGTSSYLPTPSAEYIEGADGYWYSVSSKIAYTPSTIPNNVADTYTAIAPSTKLVTGSNFNATIPDEATSVVFTDEEAPNGVTLTDVSEAKDLGVVAWLDGTTYKVSTRRIGKNVVANEDCSEMFNGCGNLLSLELNKLDTNNVTMMRSMFRGCSSLTSLDLSSFNTSNVTTMSTIFRGCSNLTSLDLSGFNTSKVTNISFMFTDCSSLTSLDLSGFDTSNVTEIWSIFDGCSGLTNLNISNLNTSKVRNMNYMFSGCSSLTSLDLSSFDTSNVTVMGGIFSGCSSLTSLDISSFNTSNVTRMDDMFRGCSSLTSLDLSEFGTSSVTKISGMFYNCRKLTTSILIIGTNVTNYNDMFYEAAITSPAKITVNYTVDTSDLVDLMVATKSSNSNVVKPTTPVEALATTNSLSVEYTAPEEANIVTTVNKDTDGVVTGVYLVAEDENGIESIKISNESGEIVKEITVNNEKTYSELLDITEAGTYTVELLNGIGETKTMSFEI